MTRPLLLLLLLLGLSGCFWHGGRGFHDNRFHDEHGSFRR